MKVYIENMATKEGKEIKYDSEVGQEIDYFRPNNWEYLILKELIPSEINIYLDKDNETMTCIVELFGAKFYLELLEN
jgi:hypothetical protein